VQASAEEVAAVGVVEGDEVLAVELDEAELHSLHDAFPGSLKVPSSHLSLISLSLLLSPLAERRYSGDRPRRVGLCGPTVAIRRGIATTQP